MSSPASETHGDRRLRVGEEAGRSGEAGEVLPDVLLVAQIHWAPGSESGRLRALGFGQPVPALQVDPDAPSSRPGEGGGQQGRVGCEGSAGLALRIRDGIRQEDLEVDRKSVVLRK